MSHYIPKPPDVLACGCGPKHGCSLGDLLWRAGRPRALARHIEEQLTIGRQRPRVSAQSAAAERRVAVR